MALRAWHPQDGSMRLYGGPMLSAMLWAQEPHLEVVKQAENLERLGDFSAGKRLLTEALQTPASPRDSLGTGALLLVLARAHAYLGELDDADLRYRQAISMLDNSSDRTQLALARALANYALLLDYKGSNRDAERKRVRALGILSRHFPAMHSEILTLRWGLALGYLARGDYLQAESSCRNVIEAWRSEGIPAHATLSDAWSTLGYALLKTSRGPEAIQAFQQSVFIAESILGPSHSQLIDPLLGLGKAYAASRDLATADQVLHRAQTLASAALSPSHPTMVAVLGERGRVLRMLGRPREAKTVEKLARAGARAHAGKQQTISLAELANPRN